MKKTLLTMTLLLAALGMQAKDIKTLVVTTMPQMHCDNCQTKIKGNLRFEKGVKNIETNIDHPEACSGPVDTEFMFDRFIETL